MAGLDAIRILVLDDKVCKEISDQIRTVLATESKELNINVPVEVIGFDRSELMLEYLTKHRWRNVKSILIDWELRNPENHSEWQEKHGKKLVDHIVHFNDSIDLWGMSVHDPQTSKNIADQNFQDFRNHPCVNGLIEKERLLYDSSDAKSEIRRFFINRIKDRIKTPFFDQFKEYVEKATKSWHVPGHNRGQALKNSPYAKKIYDFFGENTFTSDHDIPKTFGSIFSNNKDDNIIGSTQKIVAETFGSYLTYFVTNGNSSANNIILLSILKPNDPVLVARSCHKSIHYAMIMSGARPNYLNSVFSSRYEMMAPPSIYEIEQKLKEKEKGFYKLIIITGCGYEGIVMNIQKLKKLSEEYDTELFVDEAWYGYSRFHPIYQPTSATKLGVPYVTQSAHKMMSALRQSAFIHINSTNINEDFLKDIYNTFTSTSPQYQLIASMDVAAMQMRMEGFELIDKALECADKFIKDFKSQNFKNIRYIDNEDLYEEFLKNGYNFLDEGVFIDPLKMSFDISSTGINVKEAFNFIRKEAQVDLIKYTKNCIQILFTIGTAFDRNKPSQLIRVLKKLDNIDFTVNQYSGVNLKAPHISFVSYKDRTPRDYFYSPRKLEEINKAVGKTSASLVTPYPPGIPLLLPGELITQEHLEYLNSVIELGHISIHGLSGNKIYIIDDEK